MHKNTSNGYILGFFNEWFNFHLLNLDKFYSKVTLLNKPINVLCWFLDEKRNRIDRRKTFNCKYCYKSLKRKERKGDKNDSV